MQTTEIYETTLNWELLEPQWQKAFNVILGKGAINDKPDDLLLAELKEIKNVRLAGKTAPYPNLDFELTNLSGLTHLHEVELLSVTHHQIHSLKPIAHLKNLKSLFVMCNELDSLEGIENLTQLESLYFQYNNVSDLSPLEKLTNLKEVYATMNSLKSLDGISTEHEHKLEKFYILPNKELKSREIMRFEREIGIRCLNG